MKEEKEMFFAHVILVVFAVATTGLFYWIHQTDRSYEIHRAKHHEKAPD